MISHTFGDKMKLHLDDIETKNGKLKLLTLRDFVLNTQTPMIISAVCKEKDQETSYEELKLIFVQIEDEYRWAKDLI